MTPSSCEAIWFVSMVLGSSRMYICHRQVHEYQIRKMPYVRGLRYAIPNACPLWPSGHSGNHLLGGCRHLCMVESYINKSHNAYMSQPRRQMRIKTSSIILRGLPRSARKALLPTVPFVVMSASFMMTTPGLHRNAREGNSTDDSFAITVSEDEARHCDGGPQYTISSCQEKYLHGGTKAIE